MSRPRRPERRSDALANGIHSHRNGVMRPALRSTSLRSGDRTTQRPPNGGERSHDMAEVNAPVLETLVKMNEGTPEASGLDPQTYMLVRIAALASVGAPPASYLVNLGVASELGLTE